MNERSVCVACGGMFMRVWVSMGCDGRFAPILCPPCVVVPQWTE
jgi:hypothetical protein